MTMQSMAQQLFAYIDIVLYFGGKMPETGINSEEVASTSRSEIIYHLFWKPKTLKFFSQSQYFFL
jgi:hypothetical protein